MSSSSAEAESRRELEAVLILGAFLMSVYAGSKAVSSLRGPSLLGEIGVGIIWLECGGLPSYLSEALQTVGSLGLLLMVFDGGVHMDLKELRKQGLRAFFLASLGLVLPIVIIVGVMMPLGFSAQESVACGIVLSSTAIGFTLQLMNDAGLLDKPMGQLIASAAMIDDVMSIIALAVLKALGGDSGTSQAWSLARPAVMSVVVCVVVLLFRGTLIKAGEAVQLLRSRSRAKAEKVAEDIESESSDNSDEDVESQLSHGQVEVQAQESERAETGHECSEEEQNSASVPADITQSRSLVAEQGEASCRAAVTEVFATQNLIRLAIFLAAGFGLLLSWGAEELNSTYLLGVFMAGMLGTAWSPFAEEWKMRTELLVSWMSRIFFACTVGFQVPLEAMTSSNPWHVVVITLAAIIGKFVSGIGAASPCSKRGLASCLQVGSAMVGRGEIGFVVATQTRQMNLISEEGYSATVWALLLATIAGPIMFKLSLKLGTQ